MGQEESSGETASDFTDPIKFASENQIQHEVSYTDIYSRQNYAYKINYDNYMKKSRIQKNDRFFVDSFYVEILKNYNKKILEASSNTSNGALANEIHKKSQLTRYEIEQLNHDTEEIYNHTLPAINADIKNLQELIKIKKEQNNPNTKSTEDTVFFCPDCSVQNS